MPMTRPKSLLNSSGADDSTKERAELLLLGEGQSTGASLKMMEPSQYVLDSSRPVDARERVPLCSTSHCAPFLTCAVKTCCSLRTTSISNTFESRSLTSTDLTSAP